MQPVLNTSKLNKRYKNIQAVSNLDLEIHKGSLHGLLGPNGSGKSTTLGMILGVIHPTGGDFSWFGKGDLDANRKSIGAFIEKPNFYPYLSGYQNLRIVAMIKGIPLDDIQRVLKIVELTDRQRDKFKTYSTGMKQRLGIAAVLLGDPDILIFDEPTNGLDPQGIVDIRNLMIELGNQGKTIILASHILDEVEKVCDHVAILKKGELLSNGPVRSVLDNDDQTVIELGAEDLQALKEAIAQHPEVEEVKIVEGRILIALSGNVSPGDVNKFLFEKGVAVSHLAKRQKTLEESFLEITGKS